MPHPEPQAFSTEDVQDIFTNACAPCHIDRASGGLSLVGFEANTINQPSNDLPAMDRIEPGNRGDSYLYRKITGTHRDVDGAGSTMPLGRAQLPAETIERFGLWIDALE